MDGDANSCDCWEGCCCSSSGDSAHRLSRGALLFSEIVVALLPPFPRTDGGEGAEAVGSSTDTSRRNKPQKMAIQQRSRTKKSGRSRGTLVAAVRQKCAVSRPRHRSNRRLLHNGRTTAAMKPLTPLPQLQLPRTAAEALLNSPSPSSIATALAVTASPAAAHPPIQSRPRASPFQEPPPRQRQPRRNGNWRRLLLQQAARLLRSNDLMEAPHQYLRLR